MPDNPQPFLPDPDHVGPGQVYISPAALAKRRQRDSLDTKPTLRYTEPMTDATKTIRITLDFRVPANVAEQVSTWMIGQYGVDYQPERTPEAAVENFVVDVIGDDMVDKHEILDGWELNYAHSEEIEEA